MSFRFKKRISDLEQFIDDIPCINSETFYPAASNIVAMGDIHGDFDVLITILIAAEVINEEGLWIGGNTVVVQTGDIVDDARFNHKTQKYTHLFNHLPEDELLIYGFLADLNMQAKAVGGRVLLCMGNHEYTHIIHEMDDDDNYTQPETIKWYDSFGKDMRHHIFKSGGILAKKLSCMLNLVVVVGDWIFCHGGLNCSNIFSRADLEDINRKMRMFMNNDFLSEEELFEYLDRFETDNFIFYDRRYSNNDREEDNSSACQDFEKIKEILEMPNAKIVVGHTVQHCPNSICNDNIFRIDTGMSEAFGPIDVNDRIFAMIIKNNKPFIMNSLGQLAHMPNNEKYVNLIRKIFHSDVNRYKKPNDLTCRTEEIPEIIETYEN
jgi:hypothetical protein